MALRIDGKKISSDIKEELKATVAQLKEEGINCCLAVIQVGNDPASSVYVGNKKKACAYIGIESKAFYIAWVGSLGSERSETCSQLSRGSQFGGRKTWCLDEQLE